MLIKISCRCSAHNIEEGLFVSDESLKNDTLTPLLLLYTKLKALFNCIKNKINNNNNKLKIIIIRRKFFIAISEALIWNENYAKKEIFFMRRSRRKKNERKKEKNVSLCTCRANNFQFTPLTLKRSSAFSFQLSKTLAKIESGCWGRKNIHKKRKRSKRKWNFLNTLAISLEL